MTSEPDVTSVTETATVHEAAAARFAPLKLNRPAPALAVTTPPGQVVTGLGFAARIIPAGILSTKPTLVRPIAPGKLFCTLTVKRDALPTAARLDGLNALLMLIPGVPVLPSVLVAGDALNTPLFAVTLPAGIVLTDGVPSLLTTLNWNTQLVPAGMVALLRRANAAPGVAVIAVKPAQVVDAPDGLAIVKLLGKGSLATTLLSWAAPTFCSVTVT